jgi:hypothetical protein
MSYPNAVGLTYNLDLPVEISDVRLILEALGSAFPTLSLESLQLDADGELQVELVEGLVSSDRLLGAQYDSASIAAQLISIPDDVMVLMEEDNGTSYYLIRRADGLWVWSEDGPDDPDPSVPGDTLHACASNADTVTLTVVRVR